MFNQSLRNKYEENEVNRKQNEKSKELTDETTMNHVNIACLANEKKVAMEQFRNLFEI